MTNMQLVESIEGRSLLLPDLIKEGLAANDRIKYYLTLLQAAGAHAQQPFGAVPDLRGARESCGIRDSSLDAAVAATRKLTDTLIFIPGVERLRTLLLDDLGLMLEPLRATFSVDPHLRERFEAYSRRLEQQRDAMPAWPDDQLAVGVIDELTKAGDEAHDSVHRLVMDLHRELNRLLTNVALESIDGARASGLLPPDRPLVRAFMKGLNDTAPLKFDHPGLGTTATRYGDCLSIQNDLGTTDGHLVVIRVDGLTTTVIYSDIHRKRTTFFRDLLGRFKVDWQQGATPVGDAVELVVGRFTASATADLEEFLTFLGSRLVFLIDWNRAQKQLARIVKRSDAIAVLKWAAQHGVGHRGFLQAGGLRLIYTAFERMAPTRIRYGARLDELIGREPAIAFLTAVLRIATAGLKSRRSERLIQDEVEAELIGHLQTTERQMLGTIVEHAMLMSAVAERIRRTFARASSAQAREEIERTAALAKAWESRADQMVGDSCRVIDADESQRIVTRLLEQADAVIDALEETAFLLTLLPDASDHRNLVALRSLADLIAEATKDYVRTLEYAQELSESSGQIVMKDLLTTADRIVELEHACDASERAAKAVLMQTCVDFRELHVLFDVVRGFEEAADALARCARTIRDYALRPGAGRP